MHNDDISTIPYSNQEDVLTKEKELHEILNNISHLSDTIAESKVRNILGMNLYY